MSKQSLAEALQFYIDNDISEVIEEKSQNYFLLSDKDIAINKNDSPKNSNEVQQISSMSQALSILAKKSQENNLAQKFMSLNEIVAQAKKLAGSAKSIAELRKMVENFDGCGLKKMATNTVFADGNPDSKLW